MTVLLVIFSTIAERIEKQELYIRATDEKESAQKLQFELFFRYYAEWLLKMDIKVQVVTICNTAKFIVVSTAIQ